MEKYESGCQQSGDGGGKRVRGGCEVVCPTSVEPGRLLSELLALPLTGESAAGLVEYTAPPTSLPCETAELSDVSVFLLLPRAFPMPTPPALVLLADLTGGGV